MEVLTIILIAAIVIIIVLLVVFFILYYQSNQLVNNVNNQQTEDIANNKSTIISNNDNINKEINNINSLINRNKDDINDIKTLSNVSVEQIIKFIIDNKDIIINDISNLDDQNTAKFIFTIKEIKNHWDNVLNEISKKLNNISDNGPWTGDNNKCYSSLIISFSKENQIEYITIKLIDNNSFVLSTSGKDRYYTNSAELNNYINELINTY